MLDCGFGLRETERRMVRAGIAPATLNGIIVTHEHQDHVAGVFKLARRYRVPVWLSFGTYCAVQRACKDVDLRFCHDNQPFTIGALEFVPYTVPHDAREPVQYVATDGNTRLGVLTDAGQSTAHLLQTLGGCDALVLECNHDRRMLAASSYPASLKQRIGGAYGHLSNDTSAEILSALDQSRLKIVIGAHLSQRNNTAELARAALLSAVTRSSIEIRIADQEDGFEWCEVG